MASRAIIQPLPTAATPSVLVVDDNSGTLEGFAALLRSRRMRVHEAPTGEDALAIARRERLDLALLDQNLPGISGLKVASALRAEHIDVAWIIYSGFMDYDVALEAGRLGALDALSLPFDVESVVTVALEKTRQRRDDEWRRLKDGATLRQPGTTMARAAWWILRACASADDLPSSGHWAPFVGTNYTLLRFSFRRIGIDPTKARDFMRVLRALAHAGGRVEHVEGYLVPADVRTAEALMMTAGLRELRKPTLTLEEFLMRQQFAPADHPLLGAIRELVMNR